MPEQLKYAYDDLLEMLGGYQYYSATLVDYIYHDLNNLDPEKTLQLLKECQEQNTLLTNKFDRMTSCLSGPVILDKNLHLDSVIESKESI